MRIALNGWFADRPHTGSGQYLRQLWQALAAPDVDPGEEYVLLLPGALPPDGAEHFPARPGFTVRSWPVPPGAGRGPLRQIWWEQRGLPAAARAVGADLLHSPYLAAPWRSPVPVVTTVHDMIPWVVPGYRPSWGVRAYLSLAAAGVRRSTWLLADSAASRRDVARCLPYPAGRITVVYLAVDPALGVPPAATEIAALRARLDLPGPYAFYIGGFDRRKNVPLLLEAWARAWPALAEAAATAGEPPPHLVIAGSVPAPGGLFPDVLRQARTLGLLADGAAAPVRFLGRVSEGDKRLLLAGARLFAFPSAYEGFGLDPLEAMAAGCPVVAGTGGSLREVVGDAGGSVADYTVECWAGALIHVWRDAGLRADLTARGRRRAAEFSPARLAAQTRAVYACALEAVHGTRAGA